MLYRLTQSITLLTSQQKTSCYPTTLILHYAIAQHKTVCYHTAVTLHCYHTVVTPHCYHTAVTLHCYHTAVTLHCYHTTVTLHCYHTAVILPLLALTIMSLSIHRPHHATITLNIPDNAEQVDIGIVHREVDKHDPRAPVYPQALLEVSQNLL